MDEELQACFDGDAQAWSRFVERWSGLIFHAVMRTMGARTDRSDIEDAAQDVFVRLVRQDCRLLRSFDPERASMSTWLTVVARSTTIDRLRRRRLDTVALDSTVAAATPPEPAESGPAVPFHVLTDRQRLVLRMLFDEEMSVEAAATCLGVDAQTIRSTKHKALSRLREHLAAEEPQDST